jgi:hypothetical protein
MPIVMFVGDVKSNLREGGLTGVALFVTVTLKLVEVNAKGVIVLLTVTVNDTTCAFVGPHLKTPFWSILALGEPVESGVRL